MKVTYRHPRETLRLDPQLTEVTQGPKSMMAKGDLGEGNLEMSVE